MTEAPTPAQAQPLLQVRGAHVRYTQGRQVVHAVRGVDLALYPGEILALVGESGSGKSSLARAMLCLEPLSAGELWAFGAPLQPPRPAALAALRRRTAMVFQDPHGSLNPRRRIGWSIAEPLRVHRWGDRAARAERVAALIQTVGLPAQLTDRYPSQLSGGQLQRVGIARALALDPALIVADEALSALDLSVQAGIANLMIDLQRARQLSWLFVAHDLDIVRRIAQRVAILCRGELVEQGPTAQIFAQPQHPYTQRLLAAIPKPQPPP